MPSQNNGKMLTLIGIMFSVVIAITGLLFNSAKADVGQIRQAVEDQQKENNTQDQRLTSLEKDMYYQNLQIQETLKRMAPNAYYGAATVVDSVKKKDGGSIDTTLHGHNFRPDLLASDSTGR